MHALQGAEIVRMYYTLLGPQGFARGLSTFFDAHYMQVRHIPRVAPARLRTSVVHRLQTLQLLGHSRMPCVWWHCARLADALGVAYMPFDPAVPLGVQTALDALCMSDACQTLPVANGNNCIEITASSTSCAAYWYAASHLHLHPPCSLSRLMSCMPR